MAKSFLVRNQVVFYHILLYDGTVAYLFLFVLGLAIGSFLNVLIYRLPLGLSIRGRSFCPRCKKKIRWFDNVPLLSFAFLRGRCRWCHSPISPQYPLVELITAVLFVGIWEIGEMREIWGLGYYLFIISSLIAILFIDLRHKIIPDIIVFPAILVSIFSVSIFSTIFNVQPSIFNSFLSAFGSSAFFLALFLITRGRGMGFGDVKLAFLMGLFLGFPKIVVALYVAFLTGAFVSLILIVRRKVGLKSAIPFGPFLVIGTLVALFWGESIWNAALRLLNLSS